MSDPWSVEKAVNRVPRQCSHRDASYGCNECSRVVREYIPMFPLQTSRNHLPGPKFIPWEVAEKAWARYDQLFNSRQSVERIAEQGGFSWGEMDQFYPKWREHTERIAKEHTVDRELLRRAAEVMRENANMLRALLNAHPEWPGFACLENTDKTLTAIEVRLSE